ncbi:uncharacterized protein LOC133823779 [Humulus lupulus]|uniref:uncharacterized protein LOC133823779 n=1 Tax=Humulus lupulus TaxID=3486 RepID=UPI002B40F14C|nr:uncharacterized protein LOC133823779 [Humulus lupulus]
MAATNNPNAGGRPLPQILEEQTPHTEDYPRRPGKQPMMDHDPDEGSASSDSRGPPTPKPDDDLYYNPERYIPIIELENRQLCQQLARQAAEFQAPPRRPKGRPCRSTAARRVGQGAQPRPRANTSDERPRRNTQTNTTGNPNVEVTTGTGNNRAPPAPRGSNPESVKNNPEHVRANSGPSRANNGSPPPLPIRHPPSLIRHPSPIREAPRPDPHRNQAGVPTPQWPSCSGSRDGNRRTQPGHRGEREATREHRAAQPMGSHMSRSQTTGARRLVEDPPHNHQAHHPERNVSFMSGSLDLTRSVSIYNTEPRNTQNYGNNPNL